MTFSFGYSYLFNNLSSPQTKISPVETQCITILEPLSTFLYRIFESEAGIGSILFFTGYDGILAPAKRLFDKTAKILEWPSIIAELIDKTNPSKVMYPTTLNFSSGFYDSIKTFLLLTLDTKIYFPS